LAYLDTFILPRGLCFFGLGSDEIIDSMGMGNGSMNKGLFDPIHWTLGSRESSANSGSLGFIRTRGGEWGAFGITGVRVTVSRGSGIRSGAGTDSGSHCTLKGGCTCVSYGRKSGCSSGEISLPSRSYMAKVDMLVRNGDHKRAHTYFQRKLTQG